MCITNGRISPEFNGFTSKDKSVVDYIVVPHDFITQCTKCEVQPTNDLLDKYGLFGLLGAGCKAPDHALVTLTCYIHNSVTTDEYANSNVNPLNAESVNKRYYFDVIPEEFMASPQWYRIIDSLLSKVQHMGDELQEVDSIYNDLCTAILSEMDDHIKYSNNGKKTRKKFKNYKPYWNDELTESWKTMAEAERLYKRCRDRSRRKHFRNEFLYKRSCFDKLLRCTERKYNRELADKIENINTEDPKHFWDHIKKLGPSVKKDIPVQVYDDQDNLVSDKSFVLDKWKDEFATLYNKPQCPSGCFDEHFYQCAKAEKQRLESLPILGQNLPFNDDFTIHEIKKACSKLKPGKAIGVDLIPNEVLKRAGLQEILLCFVNSCFSSHIMPSAWQKAIISPIPKSASKDPYTPLNYRGISLLSCVYKLYSRLINERLINYCEDNELLVDEQNGFRPGRACMDHVYVLSSIVRNRKCDNKATFAAFIDMKKAFDWVDRDLLFFKIMHHFNIKGKMYNAIVSLYSNSSACVKLNDMRTDWFDISSGVKQGDTLSPTLFDMYLNDLATDVKSLNVGVDIDGYNISILLYADDVVLIAPDEASLQMQLNTVYQWCRKWRMLVNEDKTQIVHFRPTSHTVTDFRFMYGNHELSIVTSYKYLGVYFDEHLTFISNANALSGSASRAMGLLRYKLKFLKKCGCSTYTKLFSSYICPILDYCAGIWGMKAFDGLERVQLNALRYFLGVHKYAANDFLLGEAGWISCHARHQLAALRLWNRLINLPSFRVTTGVFLWDLSYYRKAGSWSFYVKNLLADISMRETFDLIECCDLETCFQRIKFNENVKWNNNRMKKTQTEILQYVQVGFGS